MCVLKRLLAIILIVLFTYPTSLCFANENDDISILLNGSRLVSDSEAYNKNGRIMLPIRAVFESCGYEVSWNDSEKKAVCSNGDTNIEMTLGKNTYTVNDEVKEMDTSVEISNDRIFAPVRYVSEAVGKRVSYHAESKTVVISDKYEYNFYDNLTVAIPTFDSVTSAKLISKSATDNDAYEYMYEYDDDYVTEYFNCIQADFGMSLYDMRYDNNGNCYMYSVDDTVVIVTDNYKNDSSVMIQVIPDPFGEYVIKHNNNVSDSEFYGIYIPDYGSVTGSRLIDTYSDDDMSIVYRYEYNQYSVNAYEKYLIDSGWILYDSMINMDSMSRSKYWVKGNYLVAVVQSYIYDEVWIFPELR